MSVDSPAMPRLYWQPKGTSLCADFHCACGWSGHIDEDFVYFIRCPDCGVTYEVSTTIALTVATEDQIDAVTWPSPDDHDPKTGLTTIGRRPR